MIDLIAATLATSSAVWTNERARARALDQLESARAMLDHLATLDPLTNVFNRRYFFNQARIELENASLRKSRTSMILFDIDEFKKINDTFGHKVGDQVLVGPVNLCQQNLRGTDTLARLGGEEFVILLPRTDLPEAHHIAERLRLIVESTPVQTDGDPLTVTISVGVTGDPVSEGTDSALATVQGADQAMYLAKRAGGNQVFTLQALSQD